MWRGEREALIRRRRARLHWASFRLWGDLGAFLGRNHSGALRNFYPEMTE
jgi:hypothetical protein